MSLTAWWVPSHCTTKEVPRKTVKEVKTPPNPTKIVVQNFMLLCNVLVNILMQKYQFCKTVVHV